MEKLRHVLFLSILQNWNDTEKISMVPAQGWHANVEERSFFQVSLSLSLPPSVIFAYHSQSCTIKGGYGITWLRLSRSPYPEQRLPNAYTRVSKYRQRTYQTEARAKIAGIAFTTKPDWNWSSFQLASSTPPLSVPGSARAPSARTMRRTELIFKLI